MQKINKLSPTLVKNLSVASESDTIDFLVYGKNLNYIKNSLEQQNCKVTVLNIINAVFLFLKECEIKTVQPFTLCVI